MIKEIEINKNIAEEIINELKKEWIRVRVEKVKEIVVPGGEKAKERISEKIFCPCFEFLPVKTKYIWSGENNYWLEIFPLSEVIEFTIDRWEKRWKEYYICINCWESLKLIKLNSESKREIIERIAEKLNENWIKIEIRKIKSGEKIIKRASEEIFCSCLRDGENLRIEKSSIYIVKNVSRKAYYVKEILLRFYSNVDITEMIIDREGKVWWRFYLCPDCWKEMAHFDTER